MRIEAVTPIALQLPDRRIDLDPGCPVDLPDAVARKLLAKAPGKVRVCGPVRPGAVVSWESPLFGVLSGVALRVTGRTVTVWHPLTGQEAALPLAWCHPPGGEEHPVENARPCMHVHGQADREEGKSR